MSKSLYLIKKHCPNLFKLLVENGSSNLANLDTAVQNQLEERTDNNTSLIRLLLRVEDEDPFLTSFARYMDNLIGEMLQLVPKQKMGIWDSFKGKFSNIMGWNFLNPIGELSALKQFLSDGKYSLLAMESIYPNGRPKDFLLKLNANNEEFLVEVVNIHIPIGPVTGEEIIASLLEKIKYKIKRETEGVTHALSLDKLIIMPVVWYLNIETLQEQRDFFTSFSSSMGASAGLSTKSFGFHTYIKTETNKILFEEASLILGKIDNQIY